MFRSRVSGMGGILDTINPPSDLGNIGTVVRQKDGTTLPGLDTNPYAHDFDYYKYYKMDTEKQAQTEMSTPAPTPAPPKPTGSAIPLLLGAAYLLLS